MKRKIIYTGSFHFPNKDAAAARVLGNGKIFRDLGYEVIFSGAENCEREEDLSENGKYYYQGFEYFSANKNNKQKSVVKNYVNKGKRIFETIDSIKDNLESIVLYNSNTFFTRRAIKFCKNNKINLILDLTEWYNGSHLPFGKWGPMNLDNQYRMRYLNFKIKNVITISDFLYSYYSRKEINVVKIPPLVDFDDIKWKVEKTDYNNKYLKFIYAGTPGKRNYLGKLKEKDFLGNFIKAISVLKKEKGIIIYLSVYGIKKKDFLSFYNLELLDLNKQIECYGRINQELIPNQLVQSDYSVLLRPIKKYTKAGFSTKLVESMSSGVPLLTNKNHGNVNKIINNNERGYLIETHSIKDIIKGLECLIEEDKTIHAKRAKEAKQYASSFFNYKSEVLNIKSFFKSIKKI